MRLNIGYLFQKASWKEGVTDIGMLSSGDLATSWNRIGNSVLLIGVLF